MLTQLFMYEGAQIRTVMIENEPWFVLKDLCDVLEIGHAPALKQRLSDDVVSNYPMPDSLGRMQETAIVNEDGMYDVVLESRKAKARSFRKWVTGDVLPSIRKTGSYSITPQFNLPQTYPEALRMLADTTEANQQLELANAYQDQQLKTQAPKVALYDTAMNAGNNFTMMHVAKTLGIGRNKLFDFLRDKKVLMKSNLPYESYVTRGYFEVRQYTITHFTSGLENKTQTLVTPKGMAWIHNLLTTQQEAN